MFREPCLLGLLDQTSLLRDAIIVKDFPSEMGNIPPGLLLLFQTRGFIGPYDEDRRKQARIII